MNLKYFSKTPLFCDFIKIHIQKLKKKYETMTLRHWLLTKVPIKLPHCAVGFLALMSAPSRRARLAPMGPVLSIGDGNSVHTNKPKIVNLK